MTWTLAQAANSHSLTVSLSAWLWMDHPKMAAWTLAPEFYYRSALCAASEMPLVPREGGRSTHCATVACTFFKKERFQGYKVKRLSCRRFRFHVQAPPERNEKSPEEEARRPPAVNTTWLFHTRFFFKWPFFQNVCVSCSYFEKTENVNHVLFLFLIFYFVVSCTVFIWRVQTSCQTSNTRYLRKHDRLRRFLLRTDRSYCERTALILKNPRFSRSPPGVLKETGRGFRRSRC